MIIKWYITKANSNRIYFKSTKTIQKELNDEYGNSYCIRTIQKGIRTCEELELINVEMAPIKKSEMINPNDYINRKITINFDKVNKLLSVYDLALDPIYNTLPKRNRLKKFIRKRPFSYYKNVEEKYKEYSNGGRKAYTNSTELFSTFAYEVTSKFFGINRVIRKHIPACLVNKERMIEEALNAKPHESQFGTLTQEDLDYFKCLKNKGNSKELESLIEASLGWWAPPELRDDYLDLGFKISPRGTLTEYLSTTAEKNHSPDMYGGFDIL